jgi:hypothetical protein
MPGLIQPGVAQPIEIEQPGSSVPAMNSTKTTTGNNDRPKNETIAQTGAGIPDDAGSAIEITDEEVERVRRKLNDGNPRGAVMKEDANNDLPPQPRD